MGKNLVQQRRGKGTPRYLAPSHRYHYKLTYPQSQSPQKGIIKDLIHHQAHSAPLAIVEYDNKESIVIPAPQNIRVGDEVFYNLAGKTAPGSIMPLSEIPEGTSIYNIEKSPNMNKSTFCRSAGSIARLISRSKDFVMVQLPSKKEKKFNPACRATIGEIAGSGKKEKPILKAGKRHHMMKAKNKLYPITSGVAMNAVDHPFGSGRGRHKGKPTIAPRFAPPGRKVGMLRARRTGKRR
ncbi:MAG TPA: 50S ribosomal protein L2 [Candidatus Nanoarchaeia archaeon]|nr:50S ribosomal protein L2 [Candidatus Nanoarchaeia archaeon]